MGIVERFRKAQQLPLEVVYHGSSNPDIQQFELGHSGERGDYAPQEGPGIYFTSSATGATVYGGVVYKVKIDPNADFITDDRPLFSEDMVRYAIEYILPPGTEEREMVLSDWDENEDLAVSRLTKSIMQQDGAKSQLQQIWAELYDAHSEKFAQDMVTIFGVDGLASERTGAGQQTRYTVFNPSVLEIVGTVDPYSDDPEEWE